METKELYASVVGSHAWHMEGMDSDLDYWVIYQAPSRSFLLGNTHRKGHSSKGHFQIFPATESKDTLHINVPVSWDRSSFEIGQHIRELMGGNINHVVGLLGPSTYPFNGKDPTEIHRDVKFDDVVIRQWFQTLPYGSKTPSTPFESHTMKKRELRKLFLSNPSKNIFTSVNGMSSHNINKYFVREHRSGKINPQFIPDTKENEPVRIKKLGQIKRVIEFGFRVLVSGIYDLRPVKILNGSDGELSSVRQWQEDLKLAYDASDLPEKPDNKPYEEFLMDLRMSMLER